MATKHTHFHGETPTPDRGHAKGSNSFGYHPSTGGEVEAGTRMSGSTHSSDTGNAIPFSKGSK